MLKKTKIIFLFVTLISFLGINSIIQADDPPKFGFEGAEKCGMCHKKDADGAQLIKWQKSKHANAYKTLLSEEANKISMEKYGKKAVEAEECLKCHASGYDVDKALLGKKFKVEDGVQCETCHGPGSEYQAMKVMKVREDAVKNGLHVWKDEAEIEKMCLTCHNSESPTFKEFKFKEQYAQIVHNNPTKVKTEAK
ncbi:MAG: cytochrome c family protein [bacterium]